MSTIRKVGRALLPASLVVLAACQSMPGQQTQVAQPQAQPQSQPQPAAPMQAASHGASVLVFLADTSSQQGWTAVKVPSGTLYINPQPVVTRDDLAGVQAGTSKAGEGLLALSLSEAGSKKVSDITRSNPNKRLALVVGRTMLAAPSYTGSVSSRQLVFAVGTEQNAAAAARAIAGVDESGQPLQPAAAGGTAPASPAPAQRP